MPKKRIEVPAGEPRPAFLVEPENGVPGFIRFGRPAVPALFQLMEITDRWDRPLMCMTPETVHKQKLYFRMACVALKSRGHTLFLYRRAEPMLAHQGLWDLFSGPVLVGEGREDAALRLLEKKTGLTYLSLTQRASREPDETLPIFLTLFTGVLNKGGRPAEAPHNLLEVDADELAGLVRDVPELLTPSLLWAYETGALFSLQR